MLPNYQNDYCMCGKPMAGHDDWAEGHTAVSIADYNYPSIGRGGYASHPDNLTQPGGGHQHGIAAQPDHGPYIAGPNGEPILAPQGAGAQRPWGQAPGGVLVDNDPQSSPAPFPAGSKGPYQAMPKKPPYPGPATPQAIGIPLPPQSPEVPKPEEGPQPQVKTAKDAIWDAIKAVSGR